MRRWHLLYEQRRAAQQQIERDRAATWRLCLHESAHAVVCFTLGVPFRRVAVWWDDDLRQRGEVTLADAGSVDQRSVLAVYCAGPAADIFFYGRDPDLYGSDNANAITVADDIARVEGGDWFSIVQHGRRRADELVRQYEAAIRTLANELMQARELSGGQVEDILHRAGVQRAGTHNHQDIKRRSTTGRELFYERRGGRTMAVERPTPGRETYYVQRRCDGYIA